ncbi:MAG: sulfatase [bacterium]|nr:sulfatase [bacterium]
MKKGIYILLLTVALLITGAFIPGCSKKAEKDLSVVLIVIDTLRSDHLPFYGYKKNTAPFLWELSKESALFENSFSTSSWTSPATASIHTSLYPFQHGVLMGLLAIRNAQRIDPNVKINCIPEEITTIAEVFKARGYNTYGVADNLNIDNRQGFTQGYDKFRTFMYKSAATVNGTVKKWSVKMKKEGKYFLYLHYMDPHAPYHGREPWHTPHEDNRKNRISSYDSEINYVDQHIEELYRLFNWDKNTVIIVTADHGEGLWDHGLMGHGKTLYREELQVPLFFYLPGADGKPLKGRFPENVSVIDILPTIRDYMGFPASEVDAGVSLMPLVEKKPNELDKRNIFAHLWVKTKDVVEWKTTIYKSWHFLNKLPEMRRLFSLLLDPKEKENRYQKGKEIADQLEKRYEDFVKVCRKFKARTFNIKLDKKKTDKLKSLGYVQ